MQMTYDQAMHLIRIGLRQACMTDVVEGANISSATYYRWCEREVGRPHLATFVKLCAYFDIDISMEELKRIC